MRNSKKYTKDLTKITSIRLTENLLCQSIKCADDLGISFSDFVRQSINNNIDESLAERTQLNRRTKVIRSGYLI